MLSGQNCSEAIATIEPFYAEKDCATDDIRLARASAMACQAGVNFFQLVDNLSSSNISSGNFFRVITQFFPSVVEDSKTTAAKYALDSLFAIRIPGTLTPAQWLIYPGGLHPGTLIASQRTRDSNVYSLLVSMSLLGTLQNRNGDPGADYRPTRNLGATGANPAGWGIATAVSEDACAYAGGLLTFVDSIVETAGSLDETFGGGLADELGTISGVFSGAFDVACDQGCKGTVGTGCSMAAGCTCPTEIRNRYSCRALTTDATSCAAAGLIQYVNGVWAL